MNYTYKVAFQLFAQQLFVHIETQKRDVHGEYQADQARRHIAMKERSVKSMRPYPPSPYDYAKFDKFEKRGMLFIPQDLVIAKVNMTSFDLIAFSIK